MLQVQQSPQVAYFLMNFGLAESLLLLLLQGSDCPGPSRLKHETRPRLASVLLQLATAPPRMAENWAEGCPNASNDEGHRVVVGTIVDCNQMFFLTEESTPHAYVLVGRGRVVVKEQPIRISVP